MTQIDHLQQVQKDKKEVKDKILKEEIHKTEEIQDNRTKVHHQTVEETHSSRKSELESITISRLCFVMLRIQFQRLLVSSLLRRVKTLFSLSFTTLLTAINNSKKISVNQPV